MVPDKEGEMAATKDASLGADLILTAMVAMAAAVARSTSGGSGSSSKSIASA
jgi:hypothetical protein